MINNGNKAYHIITRLMKKIVIIPKNINNMHLKITLYLLTPFAFHHFINHILPEHFTFIFPVSFTYLSSSHINNLLFLVVAAYVIIIPLAIIILCHYLLCFHCSCSLQGWKTSCCGQKTVWAKDWLYRWMDKLLWVKELAVCRWRNWRVEGLALCMNGLGVWVDELPVWIEKLAVC